MSLPTYGVVVALLMASVASLHAEERRGPDAGHAAATTFGGTITVDDPRLATRRFEQVLFERLKPIEQRFREDPRLRRAGTVAGLTAMALAAIRGDQPLAFLGTGAMRLTLDGQLTKLRQTTGFTIAPSVSRRRVAVVVTRTFH